MTTLDDARVRWLAERETYEAFGVAIAARIKAAVRNAGLWCETSSRAKEPHSLIKKLLKGKHTYDTVTDKVGARCVIRYRQDLETVVSLAQSLFDCLKVERKAEGLGAIRLGYLSIHIDVQLCHGDLVQFEGLKAELQVRTLAQHLWSEMAHDSIYKNDKAFSRLPEDVTRRVHLMAGLIEVADREFDLLNRELTERPEVRVYKGLERHYFRLTAHEPDPELSIEVIELLLPLYEAESANSVVDRLDAFIDSREETFQQIYTQQAEHPTADLIFQPEALMIAELLEHDQIALRKRWNQRFPEQELERLANVMGHSFE
jgi:ppGpp synthetase/RelA/SpoT-type nucleotidyltranferase